MNEKKQGGRQASGKGEKEMANSPRLGLYNISISGASPGHGPWPTLNLSFLSDWLRALPSAPFKIPRRKLEAGSGLPTSGLEPFSLSAVGRKQLHSKTGLSELLKGSPDIIPSHHFEIPSLS